MSMDMCLVMIGKAADYFPHFIMALSKLGELGLGADRVPFSVDEIRTNSGNIVYTQGQTEPVIAPVLTALHAPVEDVREGTFRVHYRTPLRIRSDNRTLRRPEFGALVSAALRRLELLASIHDAGEFNVDSAALAGRAREVRLSQDMTRWEDLSRFSRRQGKCIPIGGLTGVAEFAGDIGTFRPLLELAAKVHVGKSTTFGHGFFEIEEERTDARAS